MDEHAEHPELIDEMDELLAQTYERMMRIEPQLRRFERALGDLGMPVPADWATQDDLETVDFKSLTARQFDRLICLMEDLAARREVRVTIVRGGPTLFDPGAPAGPVAPATPSSVHMVVPR
jgi:hypothetical protein